MQWDELREPTDSDIQILFSRQNLKTGWFAGSKEENTLTLSIWGGAISDASLALISQFPDLQDLSIYEDGDSPTLNITSHGIRMLSSVQKLQRLSLVEIPLAIEDAAAIAALRNLDSLTLTGCSITNGHLRQLAPLQKLTYLCLNFNPLDDGCIDSLSVFKKLKLLHLANTEFSAPGARSLQETMGHCEVQF